MRQVLTFIWFQDAIDTMIGNLYACDPLTISPWYNSHCVIQTHYTCKTVVDWIYKMQSLAYRKAVGTWHTTTFSGVNRPLHVSNLLIKLLYKVSAVSKSVWTDTNIPFGTTSSLPLRMWYNNIFISKGLRFMKYSAASSPKNKNPTQHILSCCCWVSEGALQNYDGDGRGPLDSNRRTKFSPY